MRSRAVTVVAAVALASTLVFGGRAWAADGGGENTWAGAQASGGAFSVTAGVTTWTPPVGSSWATESQPAPGNSGGGGGGALSPNQPYGCVYTADPQALTVLGPGGPGAGDWVIPYCAGPGVIDPMPVVWVSGAQPPAASATVVAPVNSAEVGQEAVNRLAFESPTIEMAPPDGSPQLVGAASWLWVAPGAWRTLTASASAGPATATATAVPSRVVWAMGDGHTVTCDGPGTPYSSSEPNATTDCSYTWPQAGNFTVTATVYWNVTWTAQGAPGGGNLGVQAGPPAQVPVTVTESQAINTPPGGGN